MVTHKINEEPEFKWWVKDALRTHDIIISKMERRGVYSGDTRQGGGNKQYWRTTHIFGIDVPKTVEDAQEIDCKIGTDFWEKAIRKDMTSVIITFENLDGMTLEKMRTGKIKPGYKY